MEDYSHLKLISMGLLQTCGYVTEQMQTPVTIGVNKFLESFSIKADGETIHPPTWTAREGNSVSFSPNVAIHPGIVTTSDNNVLSTVVDSGLRYLLSIVIGLLVVPTSEYECRR